MKCPVCKSTPLEMKEIESGLNSYHCCHCNGNWIRFDDYFHLNEVNVLTNQNPKEDNDMYSYEYDSKKAGICPDCGRILIKYQVKSDLPFYVDHCGSCNGVWLDRNEWEVLSKNNLHHRINEFFTEAWQVKMREEMTKKRFEEHYIKKFGEADYARLKSVREWIQNNEFKGEMVAYLMDEDPYKI